MRKNALAALLLLCHAAVSAQEFPAMQSDVLLRAMQDELSRTTGVLQLGSWQKPYFAAYTVWDGTSSYVGASFGAVLNEDLRRAYRRARAEVYVGGYSFDNSRFNYQRPETALVPVEAGYPGLRFVLWSMSDGAYKNALEAFSRKTAFRRMKSLEDIPPSRSAAQAQKTYVPQEQTLPDDGQLRELARRASAVFKKYPQVQDSQADVWFAGETQRYLNSEGAESLVMDSLGQVALRAQGQAKDGYPIRAGKDIYFVGVSSMPSVSQLEKEAEKLGQKVAELYNSGTLEAYIGPVLLEDGAAGDLLYNLFVANVSNPGEEWLENGVDERMGQLTPKLGLRVLPAFLDVYDDPALRAWNGQPLIGAYKVDDEGVQPQRLELVRRGKLVNVYMSRAPIRERAASNGHGRAGFREFPSGQAGNVFVTARRESGCVLPSLKLKQRLVRMCRELELEYGIIVRSFDSFSRESSGYEARFSAYKIYAADGREEPVHGLEIAGLTPSALRGIEAVSAESGVNSYTDPLPISIVSPALLFGDLEVNKSMLKPDRLPYMENPYFAAGEAK